MRFGNYMYIITWWPRLDVMFVDEISGSKFGFKSQQKFFPVSMDPMDPMDLQAEWRTESAWEVHCGADSPRRQGRRQPQGAPDEQKNPGMLDAGGMVTNGWVNVVKHG